MWAFVIALVLTVPLVAMLTTDEVAWNLFDFVFAAVLLFASAVTYELLSRRSNNVAYRAAVGIAVAAALLVVWIDAAVGIFGN